MKSIFLCIHNSNCFICRSKKKTVIVLSIFVTVKNIDLGTKSLIQSMVMNADVPQKNYEPSI
jgi:hypothetical protein